MEGKKRRTETYVSSRVIAEHSVDIYLADEQYMKDRFAKEDVHVLGAWDGFECAIYFTKGFNKDRLKGIVAHEVLHTFMDLYGIHIDSGDIEESVCDVMLAHFDAYVEAVDEVFDDVKGYYK